MRNFRRLGMMNQFGRPVGRGRMSGDKPGSGPGGNCLCSNCGKKVVHTTGSPCNNIKCPDCGTTMTRE